MRRTAVAFAALLMATGTSPVLAGGGTPKLANVDAGPHLAELFNDSPTLVTGANSLTVRIRALTAEHTVSLTLEGPNGQRVPALLTSVVVVGELEEDGHSHAEEGDDHAAPAADDHARQPSLGTLEKATDPHGTTGAASHGSASIHGSATGAPAPDRESHDSPHAPSPTRLAPIAEAHGTGWAVDAHGAADSGHDDGPTAAEHSTPGPHDERVVDGHGQATVLETYLARGSASLPVPGTWTARLVIRDPHGEEVVGVTPLTAVEGGPNRLYLGFTGSLIFGSMVFGLIQRRRQPARSRTTR